MVAKRTAILFWLSTSTARNQGFLNDFENNHYRNRVHDLANGGIPYVVSEKVDDMGCEGGWFRWLSLEELESTFRYWGKKWRDCLYKECLP